MKDHPSFSSVSLKSTDDSLEGVRVGKIVRIDGNGRILVDYPQKQHGRDAGQVYPGHGH